MMIHLLWFCCNDRFVTGCDSFVTAFEKIEILKKLGKSRLCGYVYDRNDSFFSLLHVRAYIYNLLRLPIPEMGFAP